MTKTHLVPAVERAFRIMELVAQSKRGLSLSDISRNLRLPKSSAHLILQSLESLGYLQKDAQKGSYRFGLKLVSLSRTALENLDLREIARPLMQRLARETALTVHLAILERGEAVIIEKVEAPGVLQLATWVGRRLDVNCTGVGKALIAFLPEEEFDKQIRPGTLPRHNEHSIVSVQTLKKRLVEVRKLGYAFEDEEDEIGVRCIGAPVFNSAGRPIAAVSVSGPITRVPLAHVPVLGKKVTRVTSAISANLGFIREMSGQTGDAVAVPIG